MTDTEYSDEKNEQELNLFSEQPQPGEADIPAEVPREEPEPGPDPAAASPAGEETASPAEAPSEQPEPVQDNDDDSRIAPPPRRPPASVRPGIVSAPRSGGKAAFPPPVAAHGGEEAHKPLPRPIQQNQTLGQMLTSIRTARGLSLEEVALATRIRTEYLAELESDEIMDSLPSVYISAYVRKLAEVYDLSEKDSDVLIEKMHGEMPQAPQEIPDKLVKSVNDGGLVNEGETRRFRNIAIAFFVAVGIIVLALVWLIILIFARRSPAREVPGSPGSVRTASEPVPQEILLEESELDALIVPETPSISILKMSKTPGVRETP